MNSIELTKNNTNYIGICTLCNQGRLYNHKSDKRNELIIKVLLFLTVQ